MVKVASTPRIFSNMGATLGRSVRGREGGTTRTAKRLPGMTDLTLNDGRTIPQLGFGTYKLPDSQAPLVVRRAIDLGYRLIDTAAIYDNERGVGDGVKSSEAFVTTKLW